jgi:hypothetical protein
VRRDIVKDQTEYQAARLMNAREMVLLGPTLEDFHGWFG